MTASAPATRTPGTHPVRGILFLLFAVFSFAVVDVQAKFLSQHLPLMQIAWARHAGMLAAIAVVFWPRYGRAVFRSARPVLQLLRGAMVAASTILFLAAIKFVPLADAVALTFVAPLLVIVFSGIFLGERAGPRHVVIVVVGFAATMIIIRPGAGVFHPAAFLAVAAASMFAGYQLIGRAMRTADTAATTLSYTAVVGAALFTAVVPFVWVAPSTWAQVAMLAGLGLGAAIAEFAVVKAYEAAAGPTIAPFQYTMIIWATLYGFLFFGDLPDHWTLTGAAILIATGLYTLYRETPRP